MTEDEKYEKRINESNVRLVKGLRDLVYLGQDKAQDEEEKTK